MTKPVMTKWVYMPVTKSNQDRLGEFGPYLGFAIREEDKLGALAYVCVEEVARQIIEDHNARI